MDDEHIRNHCDYHKNRNNRRHKKLTNIQAALLDGNLRNYNRQYANEAMARKDALNGRDTSVFIHNPG